MQDNAKRWVNQFKIVDPPTEDESLGEFEIADFEDVKERFLERFKRQDDVTWREISGLYDRCQQKNESTEQFVNDLQRLGEVSGASAENIRYAVLHGLRPNIKAIVLQHEVPHLSDIVRWGITAEKIAEQGSGAEMNSGLEKLQKMLDQFQSKLDTNVAPSVAVIPNIPSPPVQTAETDVQYMGTRNFQNSYYPQPVRGGANRGRYPRIFRGAQYTRGYAPNYPAQQEYFAENTPQESFNSYETSQQDSYEAPTQNFYTAPQPQFRPPPTRYNAPQRGAQRFSAAYRQPNQQQQNHRQPYPQTLQGQNFQGTSGGPCPNCGYTHPRGQCRAYGQACNNCNKLHHFQSCCRSAPRSS